MRGAYRRIRSHVVRGQQIETMFSPVRCGHCGGIYDLGKVEVVARHLDCSVWVTPCCKRQVDDRPPGWGSNTRAYERVDLSRLRERDMDGSYVYEEVMPL